MTLFERLRQEEEHQERMAMLAAETEALKRLAQWADIARSGLQALAEVQATQNNSMAVRFRPGNDHSTEIAQ